MVAKQWENHRTCAVSVVAECSEKPHSQGVPFWTFWEKKSKDNKKNHLLNLGTVHLIMQIKQTRVLYVHNIVWDY